MTKTQQQPLTEMSREFTDHEYEQVAKHLQGELTPSEEAKFASWLMQDPQNSRLVEEISAAIVASVGSAKVDTEAAWAKITRGKQLAGDRNVLAFKRRDSNWLNTGSLLKIAAAAVLMIGAGWVYRSTGSTSEQPPAAVTAATYETKRGERHSVKLPDGSVVQLAPGSRLEVGAEYGRPNRRVRLTGEGLFSVQHDEARPFAVEVGTALVEDLGTVFSVRQFANDSGARVAVQSGLVAVKSGAALYELRPNDAVFVSSGGKGLVDRNVDIARYVAFAEGKLVFSDTPLREVLGEMSRWYDVSFEVPEGKLLSRRLTVTFDNEALDAALNTLEIQFGVRFERNGAVFKVSATEAMSGSATKSRAGGGV